MTRKSIFWALPSVKHQETWVRAIVILACISLLALPAWAAGTKGKESPDDAQSSIDPSQNRLGSAHVVISFWQMDTSVLPQSLPEYDLFRPLSFTESFMTDPARSNLIFGFREDSRTFRIYDTDLKTRKIKKEVFFSKTKELEDIQSCRADFSACMATKKSLVLFVTYHEPQDPETLQLILQKGRKYPKKGKSPGIVWEAICLDPPLILQMVRGNDYSTTYPPLKNDIIQVRLDRLKLLIRPEETVQAVLASIRPEYLFTNGFSVIDGLDRDGFDRAGYDKGGFDRLGWNRQGLNRSGERWSGTIAGGRQGRGVLSMTDGASYVGAYRDDLRDGWGALLRPEGGEVQFWEKGSLTESFPLGGKILSPVRDWIFLGRAAKGVPVEGKGRAVSSDGVWLITEGAFRGGRVVEGTMEGPDGTLYIGEFVNDQLVRGTIRGSSGWTFTGGLAEGKPEGRGVVLLPDGTRYEGEFVSGTYHGQGILSRPDGEKFEGTFRDGKPHGIGIYFNGEAVERCEYYDGKRIDQAFLIKQENEKQLEALRQEREMLAKEKADQAEMARLAAERAAAEQRALSTKSSNKLIAAIFGVGAALAGHSAGMTGAESARYGWDVSRDIAKGDASMSGSKSTAQSILDSRTGGAGIARTPGTAASAAPSVANQVARRATPLSFGGKTNADVTTQIKDDYLGLYEYADGSQFFLSPNGGGWIKYASGKERLSVDWGVQLAADGTIKESSGFMLLYLIVASGKKAELLELGMDRGTPHASGWTKIK